MKGLRTRFLSSTASGILARGLRFAAGSTAVCLALSLAPLMAQTHTIEHPGILHKEDNCSACHGDKTRGKSVHSAMEIACTICHQAQTQGDMTLLQLELPKEEICFSCHEKNMMLREHPKAVQQLCVECHDAHSSTRRMLLREPLSTPRGNSMMLPAASQAADRPAANQP
jgi:predicted CXXCH cytochrome family protein